jgi:hypothetical protein
MYFLCTDYRYKKYIYFQAYLNIIQMKNKYNEACLNQTLNKQESCVNGHLHKVPII